MWSSIEIIKIGEGCAGDGIMVEDGPSRYWPGGSSITITTIGDALSKVNEEQGDLGWLKTISTRRNLNRYYNWLRIPFSRLTIMITSIKDLEFNYNLPNWTANNNHSDCRVQTISVFHIDKMHMTRNPIKKILLTYSITSLIFSSIMTVRDCFKFISLRP